MGILCFLGALLLGPLSIELLPKWPAELLLNGLCHLTREAQRAPFLELGHLRL